MTTPSATTPLKGQFSGSYGSTSVTIDIRPKRNLLESVANNVWQGALKHYLSASDALRLKAVSKQVHERIVEQADKMWEFIAKKEFGLALPIRVEEKACWQTSVLSILGLGRRPLHTIRFGKLNVRAQIHACLPDGRIAIASDHSVYLLNPARPTEPSVDLLITGRSFRIAPLCITPFGKNGLAVGSSDGYVDVWAVTGNTGGCIFSGQKHGGDITGIAELSKGRLVTSSLDRTVCIWSPYNNKENQNVVLSHQNAVQRIIVEAEDVLITLAADHRIYRWSIKRPSEPLAILEGHTDVILTAKLFPNRTLVTGSRDGTVRIWDLSKLAQSPCVLLHEGSGVRQCQMLNDNTLLTVDEASPLPIARIWDLKRLQAPLKSQQLRTDKVSLLHDGRVAELGLAKDVMMCSKKISQCDQILQVVDVNSGRTVSAVSDDYRLILLAPLPDGRHLMVDSNDEVMLHQPGMTPPENHLKRRTRQIATALKVKYFMLLLGFYVIIHLHNVLNRFPDRSEGGEWSDPSLN